MPTKTPVAKSNPTLSTASVQKEHAVKATTKKSVKPATRSYSFPMPIIEIGVHKAELIFNDSTEAKWYTFDGFDRGGFISAIESSWDGYYPVIIPGAMYLHRSMAEIELGIGGMSQQNEGYIRGWVLADWVRTGKALYSYEIFATEVYRLGWNGVRYIAEYVRNQPFQEGEHPEVSHDRNAVRIVDSIDRLDKAQKSGMNIRLIFNSEEQWLLDGFALNVSDMLSGDPARIEAFHARRKDRVIQGRATKALDYVTGVNNRITAAGGEINWLKKELKSHNGGAAAVAESLVDTWVRLFAGKNEIGEGHLLDINGASRAARQNYSFQLMTAEEVVALKARLGQ